MTSMQIAGTLVQVEFTTVADVTASAGAPSGCHTFATILASLIAYRFACETIAGIAVLADAVVATISVHTCGVLVTQVLTSRALI